MPSILIEPHYLPCIEYVAVLNAADTVVFEYQENYQKQSYRNRCSINTAQGPLDLYVPVLSPGGKLRMEDVQIDYRQKWIKDHWGTICSAYGNAPFFEHFGFSFKEIYQKKPKYLVDLNVQFIELIMKLLRMKVSLEVTSHYIAKPENRIQDWRSKIHPKRELKNNPFYKPCNYNQIFGKKFVDNLSIIDLVFCEGPAAGKVLVDCKP